MTFSRILLFVLLQTVLTTHSVAWGQDDDAFARMLESMGAELSRSEDTTTNQVLESIQQETLPLPPVLREAVRLPPVEQNAQATQRAMETIARTTPSAAIQTEYRQQGLALALLLWSGSKSELEKMVTNILGALYSEDVSRQVEIFVTSSPIPEIHASQGDLNWSKNEKIRQRMNAEGISDKEKRDLEKSIVVREGVRLTISAGLIAFTENIDQLVGQIALALATMNPKIYGITGGPAQKRIADALAIFEKQFLESDSAHKKDYEKAKLKIKATLSAIERVAKAGYNPYAITKYENNIFGWIADDVLNTRLDSQGQAVSGAIGQTNRFHSLGRALIGRSLYNIRDDLRPIRVILGEEYIQRLQNMEGGGNISMGEKSYSRSMLWTRLRLRAFVLPFYSGAIYQSLPLVGLAGTALATLYFPEILNVALAAVHATSANLPTLPPIQDSIGAFFEKFRSSVAPNPAQQVTPAILQAEPFSSAPGASAALHQFLAKNVTSIIGWGGGIIGGGIIARYGLPILANLLSFGQKAESEDPHEYEELSADQPAVAPQENETATTAAPLEGSVVMGEVQAPQTQAETRTPGISLKARLNGILTGVRSDFMALVSRAQAYVEGRRKPQVEVGSSTGADIAAQSSQIESSGAIEVDEVVSAFVKQPSSGEILYRYAVTRGQELTESAHRRLKARAARIRDLGRRSSARSRAAAETFARVAAAAPGAIGNRLDLTLSWGRRAGASGLRLAGAAGLFVVWTIPSTTLNLGCDAVSCLRTSVTKKVAETQAKRQQNTLAEKARRQRVAEGAAKVKSVLENRRPSVSEVVNLLALITQPGSRTAQQGLGVDGFFVESAYLKIYLSLGQKILDLIAKEQLPADQITTLLKGLDEVHTGTKGLSQKSSYKDLSVSIFRALKNSDPNSKHMAEWVGLSYVSFGSWEHEYRTTEERRIEGARNLEALLTNDEANVDQLLAALGEVTGGLKGQLRSLEHLGVKNNIFKTRAIWSIYLNLSRKVLDQLRYRRVSPEQGRRLIQVLDQIDGAEALAPYRASKEYLDLGVEFFQWIPVRILGGQDLKAHMDKPWSYFQKMEKEFKTRTTGLRVYRGEQRLYNLLTGDETTVVELINVLKEMKELINGDAKARERLGIDSVTKIDSSNPGPIGNMLVSVLGAIDRVSNAKGLTKEAALEMVTAIFPIYNFYTVHLRFRNDSAAQDLGIRIYQKVLATGVSFSSVESNFLADMRTLLGVRRTRVGGQSSVGAATLTQARDKMKSHIAKLLYSGNEKDFVEWLSSSATTPQDIQSFLKALASSVKSGFWEKRTFSNLCVKLSPIRRAKLLLNSKEKDVDLIQQFLTPPAQNALTSSVRELAASWILRSSTVRDLKNLIETETRLYGINKTVFARELNLLLIENGRLIRSEEDWRVLYTTDYFWDSDIKSTETPLEKPLVALLEARRKQYGDSPAWKYDPITSEKMHSATWDRLAALGIRPTTFQRKRELWIYLSSRGVSTITDNLLSSLLAEGTPAQIDELHNEAVTQGRVFDQGLRDQFGLRLIKKTDAYKNLLRRRRDIGQDRSAEIEEFIRVAQQYLGDMGSIYKQLMEDMSKAIRSTYSEAERLQKAKDERLATELNAGAAEITDSRVKMLQDLTPYIKTWKPKDQFDFLMYLRGSLKQATPFIKAQFPRFGPERIRQIFQGLSSDVAQGVVVYYLHTTLLARKNAFDGMGRTLIDALVETGAKDEDRDRATLLLDTLLHAVMTVGQEALQKKILSALIVMNPNKESSVGETMRNILQQFPGVGPKVGQFLVATGLLDDAINIELLKTQDESQEPERFSIYQDYERLLGSRVKAESFRLNDFIGGGSIKYSTSAVNLQNMMDLAMQVFREDVQNNVDNQTKVIIAFIDRLIEKDGAKWAFLRVIVDGAMNAVKREKDHKSEAEKTKIAKDQVYGKKFNDENFTVAVPVQLKLADSLLGSQFAPGLNFFKLSQEDQLATGVKILNMETSIHFPRDANGNLITDPEHEIIYDTDRHAGNYLIYVGKKDGRKHYFIAPIDFGQLTKIKVRQRNQIIDMMALAGILSRVGTNDWLLERLVQMFGLDPATAKFLKANLLEFFPPIRTLRSKGDPSIVASYFSVIAAINRSMDQSKSKSSHPDLAGGQLDFAYTDYVRAVIQLNQYEERIASHKVQYQSPRMLLEDAVRHKTAEHLAKIDLSTRQNYLIHAQNTSNYVNAKVRGLEYTPIKVRLTYEDLAKYSLMKPKSYLDLDPDGKAKTAKKGFCSTLIDDADEVHPEGIER